jgi:hypothetical protein
MLTDELLDYLFDGHSHVLSDVIGNWLGSSRRFAAFVDSFRDKIRKKLRVTKDTEGILDLRLELETAYLLLREPRLSLIYEPQMSEKARAPDFAVTFTTSVTFMLEVTRLRPDIVMLEADSTQITDRLTDAVCTKLGQFLPQRSNVLLIGAEGVNLTEADLRGAMIRLQQRAERDISPFLQRYRFRDRAEFFQRYLRLTEILIRDIAVQQVQSVIHWSNPQAKQPLPGKVRTALYRSQTL